MVDWRVQPGVRANGDAPLLELVLTNLLENAWKFTSRQDHALIEFGAEKRDDDGAICYVRDSGAGFDMAYSGKLFGTFQRLHSDHDFPGSGVGLATVRRIILRHRGNIWATGAVGSGATFSFTLPAERTS